MTKNKIAISSISIIILVIAVVAFVVAPVLTRTGGGKPVALGAWDRVEIMNTPDSEYFRQYKQLEGLFQNFGGALPEDPAQREFFMYQMRQTSMSLALVKTAMISEVSNLGYTPSDSMVNKRIIAEYTNPETGIFAREAFNAIPDHEKLNLRRNIVEGLTQGRYIQDVMGNYDGSYGLKMSSKELDFLGTLVSDKCSFNYVSFNTFDYPTSEMLKFAKESKELFMKYDFSVVSFEDEPAAKTVSKAILKSETSFEDALEAGNKELNHANIDENGKLISSYRKDINTLFPNAEDLAAVLALKPNEISKPVKTSLGYVILRCNSEPVEPNFEDPSIIDIVAQYMRQNEKGKIEDYLMQRGEEFKKLASTSTMEEACNEFKVLNTISFHFSLNYGNSAFLQRNSWQSDPELSSANTNEEFFKTLFTLKEGEFSKPLLIGDKVFVFSLNETLKSTAEEKEKIQEAYKTQITGWTPYYGLSLLTRQFPMSIGQTTVVDYFLKSPKAHNYLDKYR